MSAGFALSAVIPARDGLPHVIEAVDSVLHQTLEPREIIVVDDGSRDGTGDAVERRFGSRVTVVRGNYGSAAGARNAGWRAATSPWIGFLDADDLWFPDKCAAAAAALNARPETSWFFSDGAFRTLEGELISSWIQTYAELNDPYVGQPLAQLFEVNFILTSSVIVRRSALEETQGFDPRLSHAEDLDLWIRLARRWPATGTRRALVRYQHRSGGLTRQEESRLNGDVALFRRLASDAELSPLLRRRARNREAMAHYKLAIAALRAGRSAAARPHLARAWLFPERSLAVAAAWFASLLPVSVLGWLGEQRWAKRGFAVPMTRLKRVRLSPDVDLPATGTDGGRS
jgi:glycosyltransferase involved in cell wall biosynthesis